MTLAPSRLAKILNIEDLRQIAQNRVPGFALAYLEGGAEDHATLLWNRRVFERWRFIPDTLVNADNRTLETEILGSRTKFPLIVAPTGF
ncbi:alpha-hydroxy-acid oxidizing protein, partial [bacterium]|nr:alpha-hydroxy-acid oxidizing protein [bacterium]